jgi:hypothetical protein
MVLHHIGDPERNSFLRSNVLDVHRAFSMTLEQIAEFVEVAVGLSPKRRRPLEAKPRFIAFRGLLCRYLNGVFDLLCENARSGYVMAHDVKRRCRVENPIKGLADSQIWENSFPFMMPDMKFGASCHNRQCVKAPKVDDRESTKGDCSGR